MISWKIIIGSPNQTTRNVEWMGTRENLRRRFYSWRILGFCRFVWKRLDNTLLLTTLLSIFLLPHHLYLFVWFRSLKLMSDIPDSSSTTPKIQLNDGSDDAKLDEPAPANTAGRRRQKVPLAPGHTLAHWNTLVQQRKQSVPRVKITPNILAQHNSQSDAWIALGGKVFDVTRYMDYHPGGSNPF